MRPSGPHSSMMAPCGKYTNAIRGAAFAAVNASSVRAGIMASSSGRATVAPMPRRKVRRSRCFFVRNIGRSFGAGWIRARRHRPCARVPELLRRDEFEEHRLAFSGGADAVHDRMDHLLRFGHALTVAAHGLGEVGVIAADVTRPILCV